MKGFLYNLSYKNKLLFLVIILIFIPMLIFQIIYFKSTTDIIEQNSIKSSQDILKILEYRIDTIYYDIEKQSTTFVYDENINNIMRYAKECGEDNSYLRNITFIKQLKNIMNNFRNVCLSNDSIQSIGLVTSNLNLHDYNFNPNSFNIYNDVNLDDLNESLQKSNGQPIWYFNSKTKHMLYVRNISNPVTFEKMGFVILVVNNRALSSVIKAWKPQTIEGIKLLANGQEWLSNIENKQTDVTNSVIKERGVDLSKEGYVIDKSEDLFINYTGLNVTGSQLLSYRTYRAVLGDNSRVEKISIVVILSILIISIIFITQLNKDFIYPINKMVSSMRKFEKDGEYVEIGTRRNDELGYLSNAYNSMAKHINFLLKRVYTEELTRKEAEIKALQSQINPHFLFNTLQSINIMAHINKVEPISDCIMALSSLLEVNMGKKDALITLENELKYIDNYVFIMQQRMSSPLVIKKRIEDQVLINKIPVLLLQPLIENSIKYARTRLPEKIYISIYIYENNNRIYFEICDNGGGIEDDRLKDLIDTLSTYKELLTNGKRSIGIENVNKRLILFYGEESRLNIETKYGFYTKITFNIPI